jgi:pimeloyl-ACP methyl ester carboxylesterase
MTFRLHRCAVPLVPVLSLCALTTACSDSDGGPAAPSAAELAAACPTLATAAIAAALPVAKTTLATAALVAATATAPEHCQIDGEINRRTGIDGQSYAIRFRLRMPTATWNGRFYMGGGGGTNGTLVDPVARVAEGYATIGTDGGHDNAVNNVAAAGGTSSFGVDPQARADFAYNAYDQVTQVGKALVARFYGQAAHHAYFVGCSEGGREGLLMTQRFPDYYDGVVAGDPVLHIPLGPLSGLYTTQLFAGLANRGGLKLANGEPALARTYSDPDLLLMRNAVLAACDGLDGLADGIVDNQPACTAAAVAPKLAAIQCTGAKTDACLSADQIATMQKAYLGTFNSQGTQLYSDWQWDAGMGGLSGTAYNPSWRSWWLGSYASATNNATKLSFATAEGVIYTTPPRLPLSAADSLSYALGYNFDTEPIKLYQTTPLYPESTAAMTFTDQTDLTRFRTRGAKLMIYQGASDSSVSIKDTLRWYDAMNVRMGSAAQEFARMYVVPGMAHCSGGPATDSFDMLPQLVDWVEKGTAPDSVLARASNPGYFGVAARSRPLCVYPKQSRYKGSGSIDDAASFSCQ